jgi:hypothetical protein
LLTAGVKYDKRNQTPFRLGRVFNRFGGTV